MTTMRWCQSSVTAIMPFGQRTASEGRSSAPGSRRRPVRPDDSSARGDHVDATRRVEPGDEDVPVRQQLRVGRVGRRRAHREDEPSGGGQAVDPAADLGHEGSSVAKRGGAVRRAERPRRVVDAAARRSERAQDPVRLADLQDAAVLDVGDLDHAVREPVGVVRIGQLARSRARDPGPTVRPHDAPGAQVDLGQGVVELLVRDQPAVAGREECVVRIVERLAGPDVTPLREAPDDATARRDEKQAVVVAVGDQHVARNRSARNGRQAERDPRREGRGAARCDAVRGDSWASRRALSAVGSPPSRRSRPPRPRPRAPRSRRGDDARSSFAAPKTCGAGTTQYPCGNG